VWQGGGRNSCKVVGKKCGRVGGGGKLGSGRKVVWQVRGKK
jgi:hypothetical protein